MTSKASVKTNKASIQKLEADLSALKAVHEKTIEALDILTGEHKGVEIHLESSIARIDSLQEHIASIHNTPWYKLLYLRFKGHL